MRAAIENILACCMHYNQTKPGEREIIFNKITYHSGQELFFQLCVIIRTVLLHSYDIFFMYVLHLHEQLV